MNIKESIAEQIINGWHENKKMIYVVENAYRNANLLQPKSANDVANDFNVKFVKYDTTCKIFVAQNYRELNERLWANAKRDDLIVLAKKYLGVKPRKKCTKIIPMRQGDLRSDWATVK